MKNFTYYRPATLTEALALLDDKWGTTELLAGGTDLLELQKEYIAQPDKVVSLGGLGKEFRGIAVVPPPGLQSPGAKIGAGVTLAGIAEHPELRKNYPRLTTAAG